MPTGTSLERTSEFIARIETIARKQDELAAISTTHLRAGCLGMLEIWCARVA